VCGMHASAILSATLAVIAAILLAAAASLAPASVAVASDPDATATSPMGGAPMVITALGAITGNGAPSGVDSFLGIPYAEPPERFKPATPKQPWAPAVLNATACGAACLQKGPSGLVGAEVCLFLNVWRPSGSSSAPLPVLLYIHGGGFLGGDGCADGTNGANLALSQRVVVVGINYRLGALGFLASEELAREDPTGSTGGANGLRDQLLALQWAREHIGAFGGDPGRLTIYGESAGCVSVCTHVSSPLSRGLFVRAMCAAGGCLLPDGPPYYNWGPYHVAESLERGRRLMDKLGASSIRELRDLPASTLVSAPTELSTDHR
jgi:para-nitrobenzyl esterase